MTDGTSDTLAGCPALATAFDLLGKRWTALVLDVLATRPARFCEIQRAVPGLSDRLLTERLRELSSYGLVDREPCEGHVVYELTPLGKRVLPAFDELRQWALELDTVRAM